MSREVHIDPKLVQPAYMSIMQLGLENLRRFSLPERYKYLEYEIDHLHNIPSYYSDGNLYRHAFYYCSERPFYIERMGEIEVIETDVLIERYAEHWAAIRNVLLPYGGLLDDRDRTQLE